MGETLCQNFHSSEAVSERGLVMQLAAVLEVVGFLLLDDFLECGV